MLLVFFVSWWVEFVDALETIHENTRTITKTG